MKKHAGRHRGRAAMERRDKMIDRSRKMNAEIGSTALSNHRRELFAQLLVQGFTEVDAYEKAGYEMTATPLRSHGTLQARLKELKGKLAARTAVTAETLINEAEEARVGAMENKQFSAAASLVKVKSVLSGQWVERKEIGSPGEFDHLTDDELERALVERLAQLGFRLIVEDDTQH